MARKGKSTEEIISALREAEVRLGQGETVGKICWGFGIYARLSPAASSRDLMVKIANKLP
jgi:hypothetical protein